MKCNLFDFLLTLGANIPPLLYILPIPKHTRSQYAEKVVVCVTL